MGFEDVKWTELADNRGQYQALVDPISGTESFGYKT
jgi:hypothetical protein